MDISIQLLVAAVLATAEFCAEPMDGGVGESQFCLIAASQEISTPFFSITVEPNFLVGVHQEGRRLQVQSSIRQNQDGLIVEAVADSKIPNWPDCPQVSETREELVTWHDCRIDAGGSHERRLVASLKGGYVLIMYRYSASAAVYAPALERMTQSIRVHAI